MARNRNRTDPEDAPARKKTGGGFWAFVGRFLFLINLITLLPLAGAMLGEYVAPSTWFWPSLLALFRVWLLAVPLVWLLGWAWRRQWKYVLVNTLLLALNYNVLGLTYQSNSPLRASDRDIRVISYNVGAFRYQYSQMEQVLEYLKTQQPDILCLQEFYDAPDRRRTRRPPAIGRLSRELEMPNVEFVELLPGTKFGLVIFSKYPITASGAVTPTGEEERNGVMYADVKVYGQTLRIYNAHLESYRFSIRQRRMMEMDSDFDGGDAAADSARVPDSKSIWKMVKLMIVTWRKQEEQLAQWQEHTGPDAPTTPRLICVDMNNGATSYFYRRISRNMQDTYRRRGDGLGRTFTKGGWLPMRIDYIFASPHFTVADHQVLHPDSALSDHFPVLSVLRLSPAGGGGDSNDE